MTALSYCDTSSPTVKRKIVLLICHVAITVNAISRVPRSLMSSRTEDLIVVAALELRADVVGAISVIMRLVDFGALGNPAVWVEVTALLPSPALMDALARASRLRSRCCTSSASRLHLDVAALQALDITNALPVVGVIVVLLHLAIVQLTPVIEDPLLALLHSQEFILTGVARARAWGKILRFN